MSIELITLLMFGSMVVLMMLGIPLGAVTGAIAATFMIGFYGLNGTMLIASRIYSFADSFVLVALPFFIFMAAVMERTGVARDLYDAISAWSGRMPGGVAVTTTVVAILLASMTGIVGGEIVLLGAIALPQMLRLGYDRKLSMGAISAGGALGSMVPPSINLIIYGLTANVSVSSLFKASIIPSLLMGGTYIVYILIRCVLDPRLAPAPTDPGTLSLGDKFRLLKGILLPVLIAGSVLGSIYLGIASVSEAAGIGAAAMIFAAWVRGALSWEMIRDASIQTVRTSAMILWLIFGAVALIGVYNLLGGITFIQNLMTNLPVTPILVIAFMMLVWIVLGMFMEGMAICLLTVPIFAPIVASFGYDLIWFGVLFSITCQIGYMTPPFGSAAFYLKGVAPPGITIEEIYNSYWPFIGLQTLTLLIVIAFPILALWTV